MRENDYIEKLEQDRLVRIEEDITMLKETSKDHEKTLVGISIGFDRINTTISRIIEAQDEHAKRLLEISEQNAKKFKEIEAVSMLSRHWRFILFTVLTIIIVSLSIHASLKEVIGWIT